MADKKPVKAAIPDYDEAAEVPQSEGGEGWHPDLPRVKFEVLLGKRILVDEVEFRDSEYDEPQEGKPHKQYALIRFRPADKSVPGEFEEDSVVVEAGDEATTSCGGVRVVDQLRRTETFPAKTEVAREKTKKGYQLWVLK